MFLCQLLVGICGSPDPDAALRHIADLALRFGKFDGIWVMFDENRDTMRLRVCYAIACLLFVSTTAEVSACKKAHAKSKEDQRSVLTILPVCSVDARRLHSPHR